MNYPEPVSVALCHDQQNNCRTFQIHCYLPFYSVNELLNFQCPKAKLKVDQCVSYTSGLANVNCKEDVSEVSENLNDWWWWWWWDLFTISETVTWAKCQLKRGCLWGFWGFWWQMMMILTVVEIYSHFTQLTWGETYHVIIMMRQWQQERRKGKL